MVYLEASVLLKHGAAVVLVLTGEFCRIEIDKKNVAGIQTGFLVYSDSRANNLNCMAFLRETIA